MNIFQRKGIKKLWIKGNWFIIKRLSPVDFLSVQEGGKGQECFPFTMFQQEKKGFFEKSFFDEVQTDEQKKQDFDKKIALMKQVVSSGLLAMQPPVWMLDRPGAIIDKDRVISLLFEADTIKVGVELYHKILSNSLGYFTRVITMKRSTMIYLGTMSKTYGKTPIECLLPFGGYTDIEAFLFNSFILNVMIEEKNKEIQKHNAEIKKAKRGK